MIAASSSRAVKLTPRQQLRRAFARLARRSATWPDYHAKVCRIIKTQPQHEDARSLRGWRHWKAGVWRDAGTIWRASHPSTEV